MKEAKTIDFNTLWREIKRAREYKNAHIREESCPIPPKGGRETDHENVVKEDTWLVRWDWRYNQSKIAASKELVDSIREAMIASSGCTINGEEVGYCTREGFDMLEDMCRKEWISIHEKHRWKI